MSHNLTRTQFVISYYLSLCFILYYVSIFLGIEIYFKIIIDWISEVMVGYEIYYFLIRFYYCCYLNRFCHVSFQKLVIQIFISLVDTSFVCLM